MTQQEFYLQAAIQIAATLNAECMRAEYGTTPIKRRLMAECATNGATDLLKEVQRQWGITDGLGNTLGALFDTDPQQEEPETQEQDYTLFVEMSDNKTKAMHVIADNDINAAAKAATIFETLFVKEGAMRYQLKRGQRIVTHS